MYQPRVTRLMVSISGTVFIAVGLLSGCGGSEKWYQPGDQVEYSAVLIDISGSAEDAGLAERVGSEVQSVMREAPDGSRVFVAVVDGDPTSQTCDPIEVDFLAEGNNDTEKEEDQQGLIEGVPVAVSNLVDCGRDSKIPGSDLLGGLSVLGNSLENLEKSGWRSGSEVAKRALIISDMSQRSESLTANCKQIDSEKDRQAIVAGLRDDGLIPDLSGVAVSVEGAGAGAEDGTDCARYTKDLWVNIIAESGATLASWEL